MTKKRKKYFTVYKTTNKLNGKYYIGIHETYNLEDDYLGSGKYLKRAIGKYGSENFIREYLHIFDSKQDQLDKERDLVTVEFCKRKDTYNICEGGFGGGWHYANRNGLNNKGKNMKAMIEKLSKIQTEKKRLASSNNLKRHHETRDIDTYKTFLGKHHSEKTKQHISEKLKGRCVGKYNSQYGTCWITNGTENKKIPKNDLDKWIELGYNKGRI